MRLAYHSIADVFPLLEQGEFDALVADIQQYGLREPVVLFEGKILDGRNRYRASLQAGVECPTVSYEGDDPVGFVVSLNLRRRHLNESQRAMVAAKLATIAHGGDRQDANLHLARTSAEAAALLNVSERSVASARAIRDCGVEELQSKVVSGAMSVSAAADIARLPQAEQKEIAQLDNSQILERAKEIRSRQALARRAQRVRKIEEISRGNSPLLTARRYPVILADPPWRYEHPPMGDNRVIENHYPTMSLEEICDLPVCEVAADDAILYIWATAPKLAECMKVIEAWGFDYRTNMVWVKDRIGMGYYVRGQHELLLIARRGQMPPPAPGNQPSSAVFAPRTEHSAKPIEFYEIIERSYPDVGKIELFCRTPHPGWDVWGNQAHGIALMGDALSHA